MPLILGIESSCDETAASVVRDGRDVLSNVIASQHELHAKFGGVVPEIASRAHIERILPIIDESLEAAGVNLADLDAIAVGNRPGLIGSLLVGVAAAKALGWALGKPLIGVDHVRAHLYAGALDAEPIDYPALGLVVSGGHTSLYRVDGPLSMALLGRTIDDAVGEAYDKVAAILELGFPGGPVVDQRAQRGDPEAVRFPRTLLEPDSLDFSFSGLKTAVLYHVRGKPIGRGRNAGFERDASMLGDDRKDDVCASFQAAVMDVMDEKLRRAAAAFSPAPREHEDRDEGAAVAGGAKDQPSPSPRLEGRGATPRSLLVGGGVSANSLLRRRVAAIGESLGLDVRLPKMAYCLDNAAMIAGLAHHRLLAGQFDGLTLEALATTDLR